MRSTRQALLLATFLVAVTLLVFASSLAIAGPAKPLKVMSRERMLDVARHAGLTVQFARMCGKPEAEMSKVTEWYNATLDWLRFLHSDTRALPLEIRQTYVTSTEFETTFKHAVVATAAKGASPEVCRTLQRVWPRAELGLMLMTVEFVDAKRPFSEAPDVQRQ